MTNVSLLTPEQEQRLLESYRSLVDLADDCRVPSVSAALRGALAELRVALDGQGVELEDYYRPGGAGARA
ncbi:hypothetical protein EDD98_7634 [Streptomyces sp. PanSC19]|uniref:DUF6052 family protein n=1 Tax=Streptomyces sp. PanSC19 TaxID=1520455 RepID=UPI000F477F64|nr:DUF6052 family protein [Streptomyces sp. PanSC19]ROQ23185.1 hypothetical protein EDD98_7634 [Streptomyces sp. PanSC19]